MHKFSLWIALAFLGSTLLGGLPPAQAEEMVIQLKAPARQQLRQLRNAWQNWTNAYYQSDRETAEAAIEQMRAIVQHLGMSKLPDLSVAVATYAVLSAQEGEPERAGWVLQQAQLLDPGRPEIQFASAAVARHQGKYWAAVIDSVRGYVQLLKLPLERRLWLHNVGVGFVYLLILCGVAFLALQMITKGRALFYDLARWISPPLSPVVADLVVIAALICPIFLPGGLLWLILLWFVLLWGYGSLSEKLTSLVLLLLFGLAPIALSAQQKSVQLALSPPTRALENLDEGRLYGAVFSDLAVLQVLVPNSLVVRELLADLHRSFGQWDQARTIYTSLVEDPDQKSRDIGAALSNIGLFHLRQKDYETAVSYFQRSTESNPNSPEAFFNLSQAYSQMYDFSRTHQAMARAKELNPKKVEVWARLETTPEESGVAVDGGLLRSDEIRQQLRDLWRGTEPSPLIEIWRRHFSLSIIAAVILLALTLHWVRQQVGYRSGLLEVGRDSFLDNRWLRALVPGLASAREGHGFRAFIGLALPIGLVLLTQVRSSGYRTPLGYDPGHWLPMIFSVGALLLLFLVRLGWELSSDD